MSIHSQTPHGFHLVPALQPGGGERGGEKERREEGKGRGEEKEREGEREWGRGREEGSKIVHSVSLVVHTKYRADLLNGFLQKFLHIYAGYARVIKSLHAHTHTHTHTHARTIH